MHLPSKHVYSALSEAGVTHLHHANSVATACQFIRSRALLSRGTVERLGIAQTPQASDIIDRRYSIWFDVFLDSVDIHQRARRANAYGPVLFVFSIALIDRTGTGRLWVTKENPIYWAGRTEKQRWFQDKADLDANFVLGQFNQMIVARHSGGEVPFHSHLEKIVLDDPELKSEVGVDVFSMAVGALRLAMRDAEIDVPIQRRQCSADCSCTDYWRENDERLFSMFDPKI